jgi:hypothetical protein
MDRRWTMFMSRIIGFLLSAVPSVCVSRSSPSLSSREKGNPMSQSRNFRSMSDELSRDMTCQYVYYIDYSRSKRGSKLLKSHGFVLFHCQTIDGTKLLSSTFRSLRFGPLCFQRLLVIHNHHRRRQRLGPHHCLQQCLSIRDFLSSILNLH